MSNTSIETDHPLCVPADTNLEAARVQFAALSMLDWSKKGNSERQPRDAESVAVLQWNDHDVPYLRRWSAELEVAIELDLVLHRAADLQSSRSDRSEGAP